MGEYYLAGTGERAGTYFVNTQAPRAAYNLATTSFHEANPGHHLQTALELEAPDRHALRRNASELQGAAHVEGWGLYSERLADEMGLYAGDHERLGMLDQQALRAARLVADTGIHALGWTREQSIATLRASGCDEWLAAAETDRYAAIPGQALTYKLGQLELERVEQAHGNHFMPLHQLAERALPARLAQEVGHHEHGGAARHQRGGRLQQVGQARHAFLRGRLLDLVGVGLEVDGAGDVALARVARIAGRSFVLLR